MKTTITDAAAETITMDCDDSCLPIYVYESGTIYEGELVPAFVARRLELDRAALMEECQQLLNIVELTGPSFSASIRTAKEALSAARANFPTP